MGVHARSGRCSITPGETFCLANFISTHASLSNFRRPTGTRGGEDGNSDGPCTRGGAGGTGNYDTLSASTPSTQGPRLRFGLPVQAT